ncbi:hypothetical protein UPYG_G00213000 [Umbra pygmaea]|uniref:Uncharacterized protein n=1 Tax=Umbra pygmaea TaxID=75934 RepID=A0ABD0WK66_UMBPY
MSSELRCVKSMSGPSSQGPLQLALSSGEVDRNGNCIRASTPVSLRSLSSLSDRRTSSTPDVYMECCPSDRSPPPASQPSGLLRIVPASESSCVTTSSASGSMDVVSSPDMASSEGKGRENSPSIGSWEWMMRRNSFCLQEDNTLTVSLSLVELSTSSSALDSPSLPADLGRLSPITTLPDVCDIFHETMVIQSDEHHGPPEGDRLALPGSPLDLFCEADQDVHHKTFLCKPAPAAAYGNTPINPSKNDSLDAGMWPNVSGESISDRTFGLPASEEMDSKGPTQTSTPVGCVGNKPSDYHSHTEFPSTDEHIYTGSPAIQMPRGKQGAATRPPASKPRLIARLTSVSIRHSKAEIKTFSKPDFSSVKPKIMSRPTNSFTGSHALGNNTPRTRIMPCDRTSEVNRNTQVRRTPSKLATMEDGHSRTVGDASAVSDILGMTFIQHDDHFPAESPIAPPILTEDAGGQTSLCDFLSASKHVPPALSSHAGSEAGHLALSNGGLPATQPGNQTFSPSPNEQLTDPSPATVGTAKANEEEAPQRTRKRPGSASPASSTSRQDKVLVIQRRSRCLSDSSSTTSTSTQNRETRASTSSSTSSINPKAYVTLGQSQDRTATQNCPAANFKQPESRKDKERSRKEFKKNSLVAASSRLVAGATVEAGRAYDGSKSRFGLQSIFSRARGAPSTQASSTNSKPPPPEARHRQGRDAGSTAPGGMGSPKAKRSTTTGYQSSLPSVGTSSATTKPPVTVSRLRQTSGHSLAGGLSQPAATSAASKLPQTAARSLPLKASEHSGNAANAQVSTGAASSKTTVLKTRLLTYPGRHTGPASTTGCKTTVSTNQLPSRSGATPLKRSASSRLVRSAAVLQVDKNRPKATPRSQTTQQPPVLPPAQSNGQPDLVPTGATQSDPKNQQLQGLLVASNCRLEAMVVVLQQTLVQRDEALKQRRDLTQELTSLRGQLESSAQSCERLEREKDDVRGSLEGVLQEMQGQHHAELAQLEERLRGYYQAEWEQIHRAYQKQADNCQALMEQQLEELRSSHEALKLELEANHCQQIHHVKQQYELSLEELRKAHEQEMQTLDKTLKETEATLSERIQDLTEENTALKDKLRAEEELADRNVKDSHTLYLEQELESLKVVLDIKTKQLHQQDHKLMQMDKLMEKSVKMEECLKKVQQENEDLKARMDRHAAMSRQLSTEQAMLQESLHKESKVNKRLSMENEELIWKLHNGDISSPRKLSPTSPTHQPFGLQSPRNSAVFTSPVQSPRNSAVFTSPVQSPRNSAVFSSPVQSPRDSAVFSSPPISPR